MYAELTEEQKKLADALSDISEEAYCAGWMINLEYVLWDAVLNGERKYGRCFIEQKDIHALLALSKLANSWIYFDEHSEEIAISIDAWKQKFKSDITQNNELMRG